MSTYSMNSFTVSGGQDTYTLSFEGVSPGYIDESHVKYYLNGVVQANADRTVTGTSVVIDPVPADGSVVSFRRETSPTTALVDWLSGSPVTEVLLDKVNLQYLYLTQEAADRGTIDTSDAEAAADLAERWASEDEDTSVIAGLYSALHYAAKAAADLVLTNADVVSTNADVVSTNADAVQTAADRVQTALDVVSTNADVVSTAADAASTAQDSIDTNADKLATNADVVLTNADVVTTNANAANVNTTKRLSQYDGSLPDAITDIGATISTLIIDETPDALLANLVIPSNVHVEWRAGCIITGAFNLTTSSLQAGNYQLFGSSVNVIFSAYGVRSVHPEWWGSLPGGVESSAEFQRCITSIEGIGKIKLGLGTYLLNPTSPIDVTDALVIEGVDRFTSILGTSSATLSIFNVASDYGIILRDVQLTSSVTRSAGHFMHVEGATGSTQNRGSVFERVVINAAYIGIDLEDAFLYTIKDCYVVNYVYAGFMIENTVSPDTGDSVLMGNTFDGASNSGAGIIQSSSGGIKLISNKFLGGAYHYLGTFNSSPDDTSIFIAQGNSMEGASVASIAFSSSGTTTFGAVNITGNQFTLSGTGSIGISVSDPAYQFLTQVMIGSNVFNLGDTAAAIALTACDQVNIGTNEIIGNGTNEIGISVSATVNGCTIHPQDMHNVDLEYSILGTVKWIGGYNDSDIETGTTSTVYGSFYASSLISVTFNKAFPVAPNVVANPTTSGGAISCMLDSITTTGFNMYILGITNGGSVSANWFASL